MDRDQVIQSPTPPEDQGERVLEVVHAEAHQAGETSSDAELMWRLRGHDDQALAHLYDRHAGVAYGLAVRMLNDRASAEEVVQDAFLSLWRLAGSYSPDRASVRSWLMVMVRSRAIDRLRPASARARSVPLEDEPQLMALNDTWHAATDSMRRQAIHSALARLPEEQGQVLEWAYFAGLSQSEIAQRTGLPIGTVKSRTRLALDRLRHLLAGSIAAEAAET
ncbi:MAG: sigma-70 family RNA polymerase sigma factor [Candidatus Dormibacteria bacterium]